MWFTASLLGALLLQAPQQTTASPAVQLEVAVRSYRTDGGSGGGASASISDVTANNIWVDTAACSVGAGTGRPVATPTTVAWASTGRIVQHTGDEYVVEIELHRLDASPTARRTLTLRLGEAETMAELPATIGRCGERSFRVDVAVVQATDWAVASGIGGARSGGAASGGGVAGTGPRATGTGVATGGVGVGGARGSAGARVTGSGRGPLSALTTGPASPTRAAELVGIPAPSDTIFLSGADGVTPTDAEPVELHDISSASYEAELWLVSSAPGGAPRTLLQTGHIDASGRVFQFPPVVVQTSTGAARSVDVAVNLRPMATIDGRLVLRASIGRVVDNGGYGVTSKALPMPAKGDVVSFEMPNGPWRQGPRANLDVDAMSVRVRITPVRAPGQ